MGISVSDQPVSSWVENEIDGIIPRKELPEHKNPDTLETGIYAETLASFIKECDTPLTIGVQGEWGSGKTSLLNMVREDIEEPVRKAQGGKPIKGSEEYKCIWINTWEHSLLKSPEQCLLSIIEEIIEEIAKVDNSYNTANRAKAALGALAKSAVRVGATMTMGMKGGEVAEELLGNSTGANTVKQLRSSLVDIIKTVVERKENDAQRFVVFVDDLDRLEPSVAVMVLELLKNIFTVPRCVFVLAIDYHVVVKGLKGKFGEPTPDNEWEFRAFFDKIIQLPFMMPMADYKLTKYITNHLIGIDYFKKGEKKGIGNVEKLVKLTLGHNPRAMKRLFNSLSLLKLQNASSLDKDDVLKNLIFALVCCQISYPKVYDLLLRQPDFSSWDSDFVNKITGGPHEENLEISRALDKAMEVHEDDFDEMWEQSLFKIVWLKNWQRNRLPETSRLLTEIKDEILTSVQGEQFEKYMTDGLKITAVTAISTTDEGIFANMNDDDAGKMAKDRINYWKRFASVMSDSGCVFDPRITPIKSTHSSGSLARKHSDISQSPVVFVASLSSSSPLKLETNAGDPKDNFMLFNFMRKFKGEMETITGGKVSFRVSENASRQSIVFEGPSNLFPKRLRLDDKSNEKYSDTVHQWILSSLSSLELLIVRIINDEVDSAEINSNGKEEVGV
ncbi:MAG: hypothetical protein CMD66_03085 [Gammaproteobacteria bacterium]|nr:hypothetical protein [Gammaproteobacteria bacterium]